ncbi:hypothetical protein CLV63_116159 [Murinocardiopsis flavida]|uniref:Antibiotic biosynthesis monooxygenase n=1 Tax=Murinocardiopsis flavida TaxID=645275 RepID=A0A2P8D971_9ACTN|nr:hypothetical protein [Murinocardiopsis flavida]PSK93752.1 hypothetical protein CLV63_116159 [Murinocardiopsis flavida]
MRTTADTSGTQNDVIVYHNTLRIYEGHLEAFREEARKAVAVVDEQGPQIMVQIYIDEPRMLAHSIQVHADSASIRTHVRTRDPGNGPIMDHCESQGFEVFGTLDPDVRAMMPDGTRAVPRLAGFTRVPVGD